MRKDRPSSTAALVALSRAVASEGVTSVPSFSEAPVAQLLPAPYATVHRWVKRVCAERPWVQRALWRSSIGLADHIPLRTLAIDRAVQDNLREQVVILGAGLDTRAWRIPELGNSVVFELDHPATQTFKRARVARLPIAAREVRFAAIDFETDSLDSCLDSANHRPELVTLWIWEGVVMYLRQQAIEKTLQVISRRSTAGSCLIASYITPNQAPGRRTFNRFMRWLHEPHLTSTTPEVIAAWLGSNGFRVISDTNAIDWARQFGGRILLPRLVGSERVVIAETEIAP